MNELIQTFNFGANEVRTAIKDNGDVYFCLTDVTLRCGKPTPLGVGWIA